MRSLLLVEDDRSLGATLAERLAKEGYKVIWAESLQKAREALASDPVDLMILDLGLPDGSGLTLAREVCAQKGTPFLIMTAMNTAENRLEGYEIGAEEFIPKPFHLKELLIRVRHVLDTHQQHRQIRCGSITIDLDSMVFVKDDGTEIRPVARDFLLLRLLIERAPRVVSRDEILNSLWGEDKFPSTRTIDNSIMRLRSDLGDEQGRIIRSVRGIGYQWTGHYE